MNKLGKFQCRCALCFSTDFKGLYHICEWLPLLFCDLDHTVTFWLSYLMNAQCDI